METRGVKVRFSSPAHESRYWWAIIECDERFLVCARERLVLPDGLVEYTVVDRRNGIRGHVPDGRSGVTGACRLACGSAPRSVCRFSSCIGGWCRP